MNNTFLFDEFQRQTQNLLEKGYPEIAGLSVIEFLKICEPLQERLSGFNFLDLNIQEGSLPFVMVVRKNLVSIEKAMSLVNFSGKSGITKLYPHQPDDFQTIDSISLPSNDIYLLLNIDRGKETLNVTPLEALKSIEKKGRSPLTIEEGVAIITQYPEFLMKNNCFSLLASRCVGNKRVPALWINGKKEANLGWCWEGNPHTWLGSASCLSRIS